MKHIILSLVILFGAYLSFSDGYKKISNITNTSRSSLTSVPCLPADSLALLSLYSSANGSFWSNTWLNFTPVCTWYGVTLNSSGRVTELRLGSNFLFGTIHPNIGNLTELEILELDDNRLSGSIPTSIGNLTKLRTLWLDNNELTGGVPTTIGNLVNLRSLFIDDNELTTPLPDEMGDLVSLMTFFMDNNEISGAIPASMASLPNLSRFELFNNHIDSLPDLSGLPIPNNRLKYQNNRVTFDDVLPNAGLPAGIYYEPQDSIGTAFTQIVQTGTSFGINLNIDAAILDNEYRWYKDGTYTGITTNVNQLVIGPIDFPDAGVYTCEVTNPGAPLLTLYSRPVTLVVECGTSVNNLDDVLCPGSEIIVNGTPYNEGNPTGTELLGPIDQYGCDSIININLTFEQPPTDTFAQTFCPGQSINVNGTAYNMGNPTGTEVFIDAIGPGCDSTVFVDLSFVDNADLTENFNETICPDSCIWVNGNKYDINQPFGLEFLPGASQHGCDSLVSIFLSFYPVVESTFNPTVCGTDSFTINGTIYHIGNPSGDEVFENITVNGCDSTVHVDIQYMSGVTTNYAETICPDGEIIVQGTAYNFSNPTGTETFVDALPGGCDSIVNINLSFYPIETGNYSEVICPGSSTIINGETFNASNTSSTQLLENVSQYMCDSMVNVSISFFPEATGTYSTTICPEDSLVINGTTYNLANSTGTETIPGVAQNGCDSIVDVTINFHPIAIENYTTTICSNDIVNINGRNYHVNNTSGTDTLFDASQNGCDSIVNVIINIYPDAIGNYTTTICEGDTVSINGTDYHAGNTSGSDLLTNASQNGCDSTVNVTIDFYPEAVGNFSAELCESGSVTLNGTVYDISNPSGIEILEDQAQYGCDSTLNVNLTFTTDPGSTFAPNWCPDQSIIIDGVTYDIDNPSGTATLESTLSPGCDSIVTIDIDFFSIDTTLYNPQFCPGGSVTINGTVYDMGNPTGQEILTSNNSGCDSIVNITLTFGSEIIENYNPTFCAGESVTINGTEYNEANPSGTEPFPGMGQGGCDSSLVIDITFLPPAIGNYNPTICSTDSVVLNGVVFNSSNPSGTVILENAAIGFCDSTVNVNLSFYPLAIGNYSPTICNTDDITINGTIYNQGNSFGTEILQGAAEHGCDSILNINLSFHPEAIGNYTTTICEGDSIIINGTTYDQSKSTGTEILTGIAEHGCDSILNVSIDFFAPAIGNYEPTICSGDSIVINGSVYNLANPTGTEIIAGIAEHGCDSILNVSIDFFAPVSGNYEPTICPGESIIINGTVYNMANPTGTEIIPDASSNGCDSTAFISLNFNSVVITQVGGFLCFGDSETVNGKIYNAANPSGMDTLNMGSSCDSILDINFFFYDEIRDTFSGVFCDSMTFNIGTETFGPDNTSGTVVLEDASVNGCDSTIFVDLTFFLDNDTTITATLCPGDSLVVGTQTFDIDNPSGIEILPGAGQGGCDSTVFVNLTFVDPVSLFEIYQENLCENDSININGTWYSATNSSGIEVIPNGTVDGCDSTIDIRLNIVPTVTGDFIDNFCEDASIEINGTIYDINNPTGQELLEGASSLGCDSLVNIDLTFNLNIEADLDTTLCQGMTLLVGTEELTSAGNYSVPITTNTGCDSIVNVTLSYDDPFAMGSASAGMDDVSCEENFAISASTGPGQTGFWTSMDNAIVDHINQAETGISNLQPGDNMFIWSVSTDICPEYDQDTVMITYYPLPEPREDSFFIYSGINLFELDLMANDSFPVGVESPYTVEVAIDGGGIIMQEDTLIEFIPQLGYEGIVSGTYMICGTFCPDFCLEAPFEIEIQGRLGGNDKEWDVPNGITPNNDGTNDVLILDPLIENPEAYENNELLIFNRWGTIVYQAAPYLNDWDGVNQSGKSLPEGTYYYVLRLDLNSGEIFKGDITILR